MAEEDKKSEYIELETHEPAPSSKGSEDGPRETDMDEFEEYSPREEDDDVSDGVGFATHRRRRRRSNTIYIQMLYLFMMILVFIVLLIIVIAYN